MDGFDPRALTDVEHLADGGTCRVYRARLDGEPVALKELQSDLAAHPHLRQRFANEAELLERCQGPYVLTLLALGNWRGTPTMVTELCRGSLLDHLAGPGRRMKTDDAVRIGQEVLCALERVHAIGCVHRDIKPGNILLAADGTARLADFGIALHPQKRMTHAQSRMGTPAWAAPEQWEDPSAATPEHDLFGLGQLLYWLVTRKHPHDLRDPEKREGALRWVPERLRDVVARATHPSAEHRYDRAAYMLYALSRDPQER